MILEQHYLACLAQASYLIVDERTSKAAVVDPRRDVEVYLERAAELGATIEHVLLTHFHADFLAGHLELVERTGAKVYLGRAAEADFPFEPLADGDAVVLGDVRIVALETPGHTPESVCYLVFDDARDAERPRAVLTGDTLFVGDVGRPDLMASIGVSAEELASRLYDSLHGKLLPLPDETLVYPGHGAGSACGKNLSSETSCTIGRQREVNYALQPMSRESFVELLTAGQPPAPAYFPRAATMNRKERRTLDEVVRESARPLSLERVLAAQQRGAQVLDVRSKDAFAAGHLFGSLSIGLDGKFASWCGTLLDLDRPIVIVAEPGREEEAIVRLGRIGVDTVEGYLEGGPAAFRDRKELVASTPRVTAGELSRLADQATVLDVRTPAEHAAAHIEGSLHVPLPELERRLSELPRDRKLYVHCKSGYRSMTAASLLSRHGLENAVDVEGGMDAWLAADLPVVTAEAV